MNYTIPFCKSTVGKEEKKAASKVIDSGWLTTGAVTKEFEEKFADYVGAKYAVFVSSGTAALQLALNWHKPKKVLVPSLTFAATANEVINCGAEVVFGDVERDTMCLDPKEIHNKLGEIDMTIPVHLTGTMATGFENVIFDSAHRIEKNDYTTGIWCYSFYPTKNMTTGEGGMIVTNDEDAYKWFRQARHHGINKSISERYGEKNEWSYDVEFVGFKANNTDIAAAIGIEQLKKLPWMTEMRNTIVQFYNKRLGYSYNTPRTGNHLYPVLVSNRSLFIEKMKEAGIQCSVHFLPLHKMTAYRSSNNEYLPNTDYLGSRLVSIPLYPTLTKKQLIYICDKANETNLLIY